MKDKEPAEQPPLPPELVQFLKDRDRACVTLSSNLGTLFIIKTRGSDIETLRGHIPIGVRSELWQHPAAPVIRTVLRLYDRPQNPLGLETFTNVQDPQQRSEYAALGAQKDLLLLLYDEDVNHRLSKRVRNSMRPTIPGILARADKLLASIPADRFDFDLAKAEIIGRTRL